jgi:DNA primase
MISKFTIQKVIDAAKIEEVVGEFVTLKKRGSSLLGLCPFHNEKTPSFNVSVAKNIYKCFGCGKAGNSLSFLMEAQQLSYVEALKYLGKKYNIEIEEEYISDEKRKEEEIKHSLQESILIANAYAQRFFTSYMNETDEGKIGLAYFKERGFSTQTIERFQLGFAPDSMRAFTDKAIESGYQLDILSQAGLTSQKETNYFDFFRNRAMIPIHNLMGKVIGFGGRILKTDPKAPKYINTPESEVYIKSKIVYGIYQAKASIRKQDECYLVEGYTDVISLSQHGIENVVASSGTALTPDQIRLIKRFTQNITMLYDGDNAGVKAALRGTDLILEEGMNVRIVVFPDNEDPDSFIKRLGPTAFEDFIKANKKDLILFKTSLFAADAQNDPIKKAELVKDIVGSIAKIPDAIQRSVYLKSCAQIMDIAEQILIQEVNKTRRKKSDQKSDDYAPVNNQNNEISHEEMLRKTESLAVDSLAFYERDIVRILMESGTKSIAIEDEQEMILCHFMKEELKDIEFKTKYKYSYHYICSLEKPIEPKDYLQHEDPEISSVAFEVLTSPHDLSEGWFNKYKVVVPDKDMNLARDLHSAMIRIKQFKNIESINNLEKQIESALDYEEQIALIKELQSLKEKQLILSKETGTVIFKPEIKN